MMHISSIWRCVLLLFLPFSGFSHLGAVEELGLEGIDPDEFLLDLDRFLEGLDPAIPVWDATFALTGRLGYRDNVLFAAANRIGSSLITGGGELFLTRVGESGPHIFVFAMAENTSFLEESSLSDERLAMLVAELRVDPWDDWTAGMMMRAFYNDQIMDVSTDQAELVDPIIQMRGGGTTFQPFVRRALPGEAYVEGAVSASRQAYRAPLDDYTEFGPKVAIGLERGVRKFTVSYELLRRDYDDRVALDRDGQPIEGSELSFDAHVFEASLHQNLGEQGQWRTRTDLGLRVNRDSEVGFHDYTRYRLGQQLVYVRGPWQWSGSGRVVRHEPEDLGGAAGDSIRGRRTTLTLQAGGQWELQQGVYLSLDLERVQARGDEIVGDYDVNSILSGVRWEF
jgi:hypothetical protein